MITFENALQAIARAGNMERINANAQGVAEIVIGEALQVFINRITDEELELSSPLPQLDGTRDAATLRALLEANESLAMGRLTLDPDNGQSFFAARFVLCEQNETRWLANFDTFVRLATQLRVSGIAQLLDHRERAPEGNVPFDTGLRV